MNEENLQQVISLRLAVGGIFLKKIAVGGNSSKSKLPEKILLKKLAVGGNFSKSQLWEVFSQKKKLWKVFFHTKNQLWEKILPVGGNFSRSQLRERILLKNQLWEVIFLRVRRGRFKKQLWDVGDKILLKTFSCGR